MSSEEIDILTKATKFGHRDIINYNRSLWKKAFDEFNKDTGKKYRLGCPSCYGKVLSYHKQKIKCLT